MHDEGKIGLGFRRENACWREPWIVDQQGVAIACLFDGVRRVGNDQFKGVIVPMLGECQRVLTGNIKFVETQIMQKHIDAAQVVGGNVDFLTIKTVADGVSAQYFFRTPLCYTNSLKANALKLTRTGFW